MAKTIQHPSFGRLIPDQWGDDLMFFRQFPHLKIFWHPNSKKQLEDLEPKHRELVKQWDKQPGELPQHCRNFDVMAALQSLGVYEVGLSVADTPDGIPSEAQVATWKEFTENEQVICERMCDAMLRYYRHLQDLDPNLFRGEDDCPPQPETIDDLSSCVRFDGINLSPETIPGISTLSAGWDIDWDMEHGLQMILHRGQVIAMGNDIYSPEDILAEPNFFRELLNDDERCAYENFSAQVQSHS